ncbi:hypothetical protein Tcan_10725 [Toxocara canis]|uniref:Ubiquitin-like domain-containing protein n=1 Tax=Toxocara canis TaxID=6265 RepID=A0A0B2VF47_TOXCA|nr:hypothetical protein Tcan_10725 [Toxocara canis]
MEERNRRSNDGDDYFSNPLKYLKPFEQRVINKRKRTNGRPTNPHRYSRAKKVKLDGDAAKILEILNDSSSDEEGCLGAVDKLIRRYKQSGGNTGAEDEIIISDDEQPVPTVPTCSTAISTTSSSDEVQLVEEVEEASTSEQRCTLEIWNVEQPGQDMVRWKMTDSLRKLAVKYAAKWECEENLNAAIVSIKGELAKELGIEESRLRLMFDGCIINDSATPASLELQNDDLIDVHCC